MEPVYDAERLQAPFDQRVANLATAQHGVFARGQAVRLGAGKGMIQHRTRIGVWEMMAPDVFRIAGSPRSWRQGLMVAVLAWGEGAVASHRASAALVRLVGFEPAVIELTIPRGRRRVAAPGVVHRHPLSRIDITTIDGIPATTPARTLIDLASVAPSQAVEEALDDALRRGMVSLSLLRRRLAAIGRPGRRGVAAIRNLLDARDPEAAIPDSVFERRLLRTLEGARLPRPVLQHRIYDDRGLIGIVDFAYPHAKLCIEVDGYRWHSGRVRWDRDRARRNRLTLLGWRVIHITWPDLTRRPQSVIEAVRNALAAER